MRPSRKTTLWAVVLLLLTGGVYGLATVAARPGVDPADAVTAKGGRVTYASVDGWSGANGTKDQPLDLATALSGSGQSRPGDTIWIRGGTYRGNFLCNLNGTEIAPITVAPYPDERVVIDSAPSKDVALAIQGQWTTVMGLEVTNSDPSRISAAVGSAVSDLRRGTAIEVRGPHLRVANMVVHDLAGGFGIWSDAESAEAYGNIIYYNGWTAPDRNHGHGIYTQNKNGVRRIEDNIIFSQFGYGIQVYGSGEAYLDNVQLEGNVLFNNGILNATGYERNILLGGGRIAENPVIKSNYSYYTPNIGRWGGENNIGPTAGCNNLLMEDNYFAHSGGGEALLLTKCGGTIQNNVFYGNIGGDISVQHDYPQNTYFTSRPSGLKVFIRPNKFVQGRANIVVYNWDRLNEITVDLSAANLPPSSSFEVRDVQNFFGEPAAVGTPGMRSVKLRMANLAVVAPIGNVPTIPAHTPTEFGVFVVVPIADPPSVWSRWFGRVRSAVAPRSAAAGVTDTHGPGTRV